MTDDAPRPGTPNPEDAPPPPPPPPPGEGTVIRPRDPEPAPDAGQPAAGSGQPGSGQPGSGQPADASGEPVDPSDPASVPPPAAEPATDPATDPTADPARPRPVGTPATSGPASGDQHRDPAATSVLPASGAGHGDRPGDRTSDGTGDGTGGVATPVRARRAGPTAALVAVGTGLLGAAAAIAAVRSRADGDLDWSNFIVGCGAAAILLGAAVLGAFLARRRVGGRAREEVVTWPGVVGIVAGVVMLNVGVDVSEDWMGYLSGALVVALAALGYLATRRAAFLVLAIGGLALIYGLAFDDLLADRVGDTNPGVVLAALVGVFVIVVTAVGWLFPGRSVVGVAVGVAGLVTYVGIMAAFLLTRLISEFFSGLFGDVFGDLGPGLEAGGGLGAGGESTPLPALGADDGGMLGFADSDVWWVLAFAAVLTVLWALAAALSGSSGFTIAAIAMPAILVPLATAALAVAHPTWWGAVLAAAGGVLLLGAVLLSRIRARRQADPAPYDAAPA
ncbi:hypothetical protein KG112_09635 [Nocardioides sp. zg-ZUI104]|uniref:hypothetical protein n=1 Tax=Nocardioides faecalis TaxID=2803858 RepID=UPI001BCDD441|nr:hypothetical protein [Nocardioides faecalis]MBS4753061.1 hypothetical protein [Nocardioides faecalis]